MLNLSCSKSASDGPSINYQQLVERNDIVYMVNSEEPFTGTAFINHRGIEQKMTESGFVDGKIHGTVTEWYKNGQKKHEQFFTDGKKNGPGVQWYENGQKKEEENFKDGEPHGEIISWYRNGQKALEGEMKNGQKHGFWVYWDDNGNKTAEKTFENGQEIVQKQPEIENNLVENDNSHPLLGILCGKHGTKKLEIVIEKIRGNAIEGYNVVGNNRRSITGTFTQESTTVKLFEDSDTRVLATIYELNLREPGDDKYDGAFSIKITATDTGWWGEGNWKAYNGNLKRNVIIQSNIPGDCF